MKFLWSNFVFIFDHSRSASSNLTFTGVFTLSPPAAQPCQFLYKYDQFLYKYHQLLYKYHQFLYKYHQFLYKQLTNQTRLTQFKSNVHYILTQLAKL